MYDVGKFNEMMKMQDEINNRKRTQKQRPIHNESRIEQLEEEVKELREFKQMMENYLNSNREQL